MIIDKLIKEEFDKYTSNDSTVPLLIKGDSLDVLKQIPEKSIDIIITSPPYFNQRDYDSGGIGNEENYVEYIKKLLEITKELHRVLKDTGSFWLNLGDSYENKNLIGIPWRVALSLKDDQKWILRNDVIWNKVKGSPDNSKDKLGNVHEHLFHFVKKKKGYFYDVDSIRKKPAKAKNINGSVVSATGVTGVRYKRQIELNTELTEEQKTNALIALKNTVDEIKNGELNDFRMIIKGVQRSTHSDSQRLSGRAKELNDKGFYFLKYNKKGAKPRDVWDILPEDSQKRKSHFAPFPEELLEIPFSATLPDEGIMLDPFVGTGTSCVVAYENGNKSIGIDLSKQYLSIAEKRIKIDQQ